MPTAFYSLFRPAVAALALAALSASAVNGEILAAKAAVSAPAEANADKPVQAGAPEASTAADTSSAVATGEAKPGDKTDETQVGDKKARPAKPDKVTSYKRSGICKHLDDLAEEYKLPPLFFARLIWQESRFNPNAVSPAGAEGIAQFMPGTAAIWGLNDPYDPAEALLKSAQYLNYLHNKLGNLGLAAAGYNAGSQRVVDWLAGSSYMPLETRNYVYSITGFTVEDWADGSAQFVEPQVDRKRLASACAQLTDTLKRERRERRDGIINISLPGGKAGRGSSSRVTRTPPPPWGVQLAGSFSRAQAMRQYSSIRKQFGKIIGENRIVMKSSPQEGRGRRTFHRVRVGTGSRAEAEALCNRLRAAGAACVVMKN